MLRNRELRNLALLFAAVALVAAGLGFVLQPAAGLLALGTAAAFAGLFWAYTAARYRRIAEISLEIDRVLHGAEDLVIGSSEEGELSILEHEVNKMTLRIREQNDALRREKAHLADSLADIAHQLRTPLTSANLILSLLKNDPSEAERRALLRDAQGAFAQMDWLLNALLKLSRLDAGIVSFQRVPVEVAELLQTALRPFLIPLELHDIHLTLDISPGVQILGDQAWLAEALGNVLKNCVEKAGEHGALHIACQDTLLYTQLTLHDSGQGISPEDLPFLFERFYRGKDAGATGYGIGLALSKTILTRQGATITAKNHPQGGALFVIRFPKPLER